MIVDVEKALQRLKNNEFADTPNLKSMRAMTKAARREQHSQKVRIAKKAKVEKSAQQPSRRERKQALQLKHLQSSHQQESQGLAAAPPNSPVQTSNQLDALSHYFNIPMRNRSQQQESTQQAQATGGVAPVLSSHHQESYQQMANLMNKMGVKSNSSVRGKRRKKLEAGGLSRRVASGLLPSERTNFSNLPALPATMSSLTSKELTQLGQLFLSDTPH